MGHPACLPAGLGRGTGGGTGQPCRLLGATAQSEPLCPFFPFLCLPGELQVCGSTVSGSLGHGTSHWSLPCAQLLQAHGGEKAQERRAGQAEPGAAQDQSSETRTPNPGNLWVNLLTVINHTAIFALQELLSPNLGLG